MNFVDRWYGYFTVILKQQNKIVSNWGVSFWCSFLFF
jgi:hypothetical protein